MKQKIFFALFTIVLIMAFFSGITAKAISMAYRSIASKFFPPTYPDLLLRKCDSYGCGNFGASRDSGKRRHMGQDYITTENQHIYAPFSGTVSTSAAYANGRYPFLKMVKIKDGQTAVNIMYVSPIVKTGEYVERGQFIGYAQSLQSVYPGIPNHVHVEVSLFGQKVDPAPFFDIPIV